MLAFASLSVPVVALNTVSLAGTSSVLGAQRSPFRQGTDGRQRLTRRRFSANRTSARFELSMMAQESFVKVPETPVSVTAPLPCYLNPNPEPIPEGLKLNDVIRTLPEDVFEQSYLKAFGEVALTVGAVSLGYAWLAVCPWYLLPLAWAYQGTAATGLFVIGHDCGHHSFTKSRLVNDIIGILTLSPLLYPFESWRVKHDHHHKHTNKLFQDNAWQPIQPRWFRTASPTKQALMRIIKGPAWWFASVGHLVVEHFDLRRFRPAQQQRVKISLAAVYAFMLITFPALFFFTGPWGFVKYYLMPYLGFHFWMSTFTMIHHTLPQVPFVVSDKWDACQAQLGGTVHCDYPRWVEVLCHDISVHVPHHLSTKIPSYNLRRAWGVLKEKWGRHIHQCYFSVDLLRDVITRCHLYDTKWNYISFDEGLNQGGSA